MSKTLSPPCVDTLHQIEYSVHTCSLTMKRELKMIFPSLKHEDMEYLLVVPTCQQSKVDLVNTGPDVEAEKDRLLENFVYWGNSVVKMLRDDGYWADFTDPCSGLPAHTHRGSCIYSDVQGHSRLLHYPVYNVGNTFPCVVVTHPSWGSAVYPSTLFTTAPLDHLISAIRSVLPRRNDSDSAANICGLAHCH